MNGQSSRGSSMEVSDRSTSSKKLRKPYTITKSRDRWSEEEHERFLDALLMFGRDWKKIEDFVGTKTVIQAAVKSIDNCKSLGPDGLSSGFYKSSWNIISHDFCQAIQNVLASAYISSHIKDTTSHQIRSHAQKYFQKVQASGMMANLPPPRPKRRAAHPLHQKTSDSVVPIQASKNCSSASSCLLPACNTWDDRSMQTMFMNYPSAGAMYTSDCYPALPEVNTGFAEGANLNHQINSWTCSSNKPWQTYEVPSLGDSHASYPVIPNFTEVYNFIASMFDPFIKCPMGHFLQKLKEMDPITAKTVLLLVKNLTTNMSSPGFESLGIWLSTYDGNAKTIGMITRPAPPAQQIPSFPTQGTFLLPPP